MDSQHNKEEIDWMKVEVQYILLIIIIFTSYEVMISWQKFKEHRTRETILYLALF